MEFALNAEMLMTPTDIYHRCISVGVFLIKKIIQGEGVRHNRSKLLMTPGAIGLVNPITPGVFYLKRTGDGVRL